MLTAVMRHYHQITGRRLSADRMMAWHLRNALGDALWRSEAGIPLPDHRTSTASPRPATSEERAAISQRRPLRAAERLAEAA